MFLYRQTAKGHDMVCLMTNFDAACDRARCFVGEHDPVDGCSRHRDETVNMDRVFRTSRPTSFGQRRATVRSITEVNLVGLD